MKTNQTKPSCEQTASLAAIERKERTEPRLVLFPLRFLCSFAAILLLLLSAGSVSAATRYVWQDSPSPAPPYTNWTAAAHVIQDAVDAALAGDEIVVTNGTYATGGRAVGTNVLVNRVAVDKPLTLRSVHGPQSTVIQGYQLPVTTNGNGAIRCAYLANGVTLSGFTLTNGATSKWPETSYDREQSGGGVWCESVAAVVSNCTLTGNSARYGGGADGGTLNNCTLTDNSASGESGFGGGVAGGTLNNCTLTGNSADWAGGGAYGDSTLNNCVLSGNSAGYCGGGAYGGTLNNCTLTGNSAREYGGGALGGTLNNCTLTGNLVTDDKSGLGFGGGVAGGTLNNCTLTGNSAASYGGGAGGGTLNNCIVYFNTAPFGANYATGLYGHAVVMNYCCTTPMPTNGVGNITNAPLFVDYGDGNLRLQSNSPCINAGLNAYAPGPTDLDGLPRTVSGTVDIGAYEFQGPGSVISYAWLQHYGLPTDGSADATDADADGHNTWQEWRCLTDPTNALSVLRLLAASPTGKDATLTWQSVAGVNYFLERATNMSSSPLFSPLATDIPGQPGTTTFTDTNPVPLSPLFYRVGVGD